MNTPNFLETPTPKITFKLPAKDGQALADWLEKAEAWRKHISNSSSAVRGLEKKRAELQGQIEKLEARADELDAAEKLPVLQTQLRGVERRIEEASASEFGEATKLLLFELGPVMSKAIGPIIDKEAAKVADTLKPYFKSRHRAITAVRHSDWFYFLTHTFMNDFSKLYTLDASIHIVQSVLNNELPYPYDPNPSATDLNADANSVYNL